MKQFKGKTTACAIKKKVENLLSALNIDARGRVRKGLAGTQCLSLLSFSGEALCKGNVPEATCIVGLIIFS